MFVGATLAVAPRITTGIDFNFGGNKHAPTGELQIGGVRRTPRCR
jgi:hypothetical protein